ncbi:MAG: hypothetical protein HAW62_02705 [Endozoicomonadaceae bacterium]|nr:hypothetical protein [Endozoicomonadaceae bacterium]
MENGVKAQTNGLVREYLPKKTEFMKIENDEILVIQSELNNKPRMNEVMRGV